MRETKSVSAETTFNADIAAVPPARTASVGPDRARLDAAEESRPRRLDRHAQAQERRLQDPHPRRARCRSRPSSPTLIFAAGRDLLRARNRRTRYRLIGIGVSNLGETEGDDLADLIDRRAARSRAARSTSCARNSARDAVVKGLALDGDDEDDRRSGR